MTGSDPVTHMLDVPGARLYYERRGTGPLLLLIGSPMDSTGFAGLAGALAGRYTVVTYDRGAPATAPARTPARM
jgi:clorobiocin/coumermycin A biosynthesis protein CloN7/CouN7